MMKSKAFMHGIINIITNRLYGSGYVSKQTVRVSIQEWQILTEYINDLEQKLFLED